MDFRLRIANEGELTNKKARRRAALGFSIPENLDTPEFTEAWNLWQRHRSEKGKKQTPTSIKMQLSELSEMGPAPSRGRNPSQHRRKLPNFPAEQ